MQSINSHRMKNIFYLAKPLIGISPTFESTDSSVYALTFDKSDNAAIIRLAYFHLLYQV